MSANAVTGQYGTLRCRPAGSSSVRAGRIAVMSVPRTTPMLSPHTGKAMTGTQEFYHLKFLAMCRKAHPSAVTDDAYNIVIEASVGAAIQRGSAFTDFISVSDFLGQHDRCPDAEYIVNDPYPPAIRVLRRCIRSVREAAKVKPSPTPPHSSRSKPWFPDALPGARTLDRRVG